MKKPLVVIASFFLFSFFFCLQASAQKVMVTSTVENFELTQFNCGCPSYGGDAAFAISLANLDLTDAQGDRLLELVSEFERVNGVNIRSKTEVRNASAIKDKIKTTATGPLSGAGKELCDYVKTLMN